MNRKNDPIAWFQSAENMRTAAVELFRSGNPLLWFPAALLGHQALEMFLKAALIREGLEVGPPPKGTVWGHRLICLGEKLTAIGKNKLPDVCFETLAYFDECFKELRYPTVRAKGNLKLGENEAERLEAAVSYILPYAKPRKHEVAAAHAARTIPKRQQ